MTAATTLEIFLASIDLASLAPTMADLGLSSVADVSECEASDLVSDLGIKSADAETMVAKAKETVLFDTRKEHIQSTWKAVEDTLAADATKLFYKHLFEEHPEAAPLFQNTDMDEQSEKLYKTLQIAVKFLDDVDGLIPVLQEMGEQHALDYGTIAAHYDIVGGSLLWTLKTGLGDAWTPEVADAWTWVYGIIAKTMSDAGDAALEAKAAGAGRIVVSAKSIGIGTLPDVDLTLTDDEKKAVVKESWSKVEPIAEHATKIFYKMLRETDEEANKLFEAVDMDAQEGKLAATLCVAVKNLNELDSLVPVLEDMAGKK